MDFPCNFKHSFFVKLCQHYLDLISSAFPEVGPPHRIYSLLELGRVTSAYFQNPSVGYWFLLSLCVLESDKSLTGAVIHNCMEMFPELNMARGIVFAVLLSP